MDAKLVGKHLKSNKILFLYRSLHINYQTEKG